MPRGSNNVPQYTVGADGRPRRHGVAGADVRAWRQAQHVSQEAAAEWRGVSLRSWQQYERGWTLPADLAEQVRAGLAMQGARRSKPAQLRSFPDRRWASPLRPSRARRQQSQGGPENVP
jgi:predicted transcriptional regulator